MSTAKQDLSEEQLEELKQAFKLFDKDGDGTVDKKELKEVLESLGTEPTDEDIDDMMAEVDEDNNGVIDFEEFVALMSQKLHDVDKEQEIREAFALFDKDGNGKIDSEELRSVLKKLVGEDLSQEEVEEMIQTADLDGDGEIDFEEFRAMMLK